MIAASRTALVLLAAGLSTRFGGSGSKLDADLDGVAVGLHVVRALHPIGFAARLAITGRSAIDYAAHGFATVANPDPAAGMGRSVALGAAHADALGVAALLVVLADMPCVTRAHIERVLDAGDGTRALVASTDGVTRSPPALFGAHWFPELLALDGEAGARDLIRRAHPVPADPPEQLADIDTPAALARVRAAIRGAARRLD